MRLIFFQCYKYRVYFYFVQRKSKIIIPSWCKISRFRFKKREKVSIEEVFAKQKNWELLSFDDLHRCMNFPMERIFTFQRKYVRTIQYSPSWSGDCKSFQRSNSLPNILLHRSRIHTCHIDSQIKYNLE